MDDQNNLHNADTGLDDATQGVIDDLNQRLAETEARYKRALADYQNSQRRALENERRAHDSGAAGVVERLVPVLDHMRLALDVEPAKVTAESMLAGVQAILNEFSKVLASHGVEVIDPRENEAFDPMRHQAVMQAAKDGVAPGRIVQSFQIGYAMGDRIIRPAKVSVTPADDSALADESADCCNEPGCGCAPHESDNFETPGANDVRVHHHGPKSPNTPNTNTNAKSGGCCGGGGCGCG
jgi:molecular chaperone GrpE